MESNIKFCFISLLCLLFNLRSFKAEDQKLGAHSHMHSDGSLAFFTPEDLNLGKVIPDQPLITNPASSPKILPREDAQLIPFALSQLPSVVQLFGFSKDSSEAMAMKDTLSLCKVSPIEGESKFCATSLESMLDYVNQTLGSPTGFKAISTRLVVKGNKVGLNQYYTIVKQPRQVSTPKSIACHLISYPYAVYYCHLFHKDVTMIKVFLVTLRGENGGLIEAVCNCHMDTSSWKPDHLSFRVYGIKRGSPACHLLATDDLVWVPLSKPSTSTTV